MSSVEIVPIRCQFCGSTRFEQQRNPSILQCQYCEGLTAIKQGVNVPQEFFETEKSNYEKNDLLRRLRYFIEHAEIGRADKALDELKYKFPGDYNVMFSEKALEIKKDTIDIRSGRIRPWSYSPNYFQELINRIMSAAKMGVNTDEVYNVLFEKYKAIKYGTLDERSDGFFSNEWDNFSLDASMPLIVVLIKRRAVYENLIVNRMTAINQLNSLKSDGVKSPHTYKEKAGMGETVLGTLGAIAVFLLFNSVVVKTIAAIFALIGIISIIAFIFGEVSAGSSYNKSVASKREEISNYEKRIPKALEKLKQIEGKLLN